jgi:Ca2+-binding EF-hand superfamily protein
LRLKKVAVKNAIGQAKEEESAIRDASPPVKESARKKLPSDGEAKEAITEAHSLASEEKSENGEEGSLDENLNMTIDQIQRLASGLMSTATHNVGSRANSTHITSPILISKKTISSGGHAVVVLDRRSDPVESKSSACDPPSPLMLGANEDSTRHAHEETDPVSRDNVLTNTGSAANVRDYSDTPAMKRMSSSVLETFKVGGGVNYDEFCRAVNSVGMPILATKHVFDVFDQSGTGIVSVSEFMSTMVAFRVDMLDAAANAETDEEFKRSKTRFLFNIFDLDGSGMISRSELHHVIGVLLSETGEQDLEKIEIVRRHRVSNAGGTSPMRSSFTSPSQENQNTNSSSTVTASSAAATSPGRKHGRADGLRDSSTEVLLDFHPEHTNNILIGNEGIEIDINSLFDSIDTDGSGEISFSEFEVW